MKRWITLLGALLLMPTLASAQGELVSISELRAQVGQMGRWTQTYEAYGRTIDVDIPIIVPEVETVPVVEVTVWNDYVRQLANDDAVYSITDDRMAAALLGQSAEGEEAQIDVFDDGTELRVMFHSPEDLLGQKKGDYLKIEEKGFYPWQLDFDSTCAEDNPMPLAEAEHQLERILQYFAGTRYDGMTVDYVRVARRGRKTRSYSDEKLGETVDYYPMGSYEISYMQNVRGIPVRMPIQSSIRDTQTTGLDYEAFGRMGITTGISQIMREDSFWLTIKWLEEQRTLCEDMALMPIDRVIACIEREIDAGHIRNVYALRLAYVLYLNERSPATYTLFPMWVLECDYVENAGKELKRNPYTDEVRNGFSFERLSFNPQTGKMMDIIRPKQEDLYAPAVLQ